MGKYYTQTTAALNAVTIDTAKLDAQNILIYPGEGDRKSRINVAESLKSVSNLDAAIFGEEVARTYNSADIPTNHTLDGANITAIRLSRRHCVSGKVNTIKIPYASATINVTAYLSVQVFLDNTTSYIKYSDNTQTQANGTSGESVFTFTDFTLPNEYKFIQLCFVTSKTSVPDVSNNTGNTGFRVRIVKNSDASNALEWDDDDCGLYANLTYKNWISQVIIDYTLARGLVGQVSDINDSITEIHELLKNVGPSDDCALKSTDNTFTANNTFTNDITIDGARLILINGASLEIPDEEVSIVSETTGDSTIITHSDEEIITVKVISYRQVTTEISPLVTITKRVPAEAYLNLINIDDMLNSMWANMAQAAPFDYEPFVEEYTSSGMQEGPNGWLFTIKRKHLGQLQLAFSQISNALTEVGGNSFEVIIL